MNISNLIDALNTALVEGVDESARVVLSIKDADLGDVLVSVYLSEIEYFPHSLNPPQVYVSGKADKNDVLEELSYE